jgi:hypothetical protein
MVSLLWQAMLARVGHVQLDWPRVSILGISVWLAYAADRWIEGWRLTDAQVQTPRHRFYQRYRWPVASIWIGAFIGDVYLAVSSLSREELIAGFMLMAAVVAYLLSHQLVHRNHPWRLPKEVVIAALLSGGVGIFLLQSPRFAAVAMPLSLFALLSFTNCALISVWERQVDRAHGQTSLAVDSNVITRAIRQLPWLVLLVAIAAVLANSGAARAAALCAAASAILLASIDGAEHRLGRQPARVLADVALMTPVIPLLWP